MSCDLIKDMASLRHTAMDTGKTLLTSNELARLYDAQCEITDCKKKIAKLQRINAKLLSLLMDEKALETKNGTT